MYISYKDLAIEQVKNLEYKIKSAVEAISKGISASKHNIALAFSGGKDSTVLWDLIRRFYPEAADKMYIIYGNTGVEYPESLSFARQIGNEWGGNKFYEATPLKTEASGLKYAAQQEVLQYYIDNNRIGELLKEDGKLKSTGTLESACPAHLMEKFIRDRLIWAEGHTKNYWWCIDQYGWPLLGKAFSKLKAHRINIDCFLKFSKSESEDPKLHAYYDILRDVKISQACCDTLKKEPSEKLQAELHVDVIFKGLMAAESRSRQTNFISRGYLFESSRPHLGSDSFYHCNPLSIWTDDDIWEYINRFHVPYSPLYDMGWTDDEGAFHKIQRNGCMGCGTDLLYANNHMAMLRRTHPKYWEMFMRKGMAAELNKLRVAKSNGQLSLFDVIDVNQVIDERPCIFDRIDRLVMFDNTVSPEDMLEYDPDVV